MIKVASLITSVLLRGTAASPEEKGDKIHFV